MAVQGLLEIIKGIFIKSSDTAGDDLGEIRVDSADNKLKYHNGSSESAAVTEDHTATLTNKVISGGNNTITAVDGDNVVIDSITNMSATDAQAAFAEHQADFDALTADEVANVPAGSVIATDVQAAINELDADISAVPIGDVVGPGAATDHGVARFDTTTGKLLQNSGVTIDDSGNMIVPGDFTVNGVKTIINTTDLDVTDQNITLNDTGNDASSEGAGLTIERTGTYGSIIYADAATSKFKAGSVGSEIELADISSTQIITNKDIDGGTASDTSRLTLPKETKVNLDSLTRKQATIAYTSDEDKAYLDNGVSIDAVVTEAKAQNISNKALSSCDFDGGTAADTSRLTVGKEDKSNLDALTRKAGTIVFADDEDTFYGDTGSALVAFATTTILDSEVWVNTGNGYGSAGGCCVPRFSNIVENNGTDITYTDSATDGASFEINVDGIYAFNFSHTRTDASFQIGITKNASNLNSVSGLPVDEVMCFGRTGSGGWYTTVAGTRKLSDGDIIRPQTNTSANSASAGLEIFSITRVG